jgi:hypothetical protein
MRKTILLFAVLALTTAASWRRGDAYVLKTGATSITMTSTSINELTRLMRRLGDGPYLWVLLGDREYLIRDGAVLRDAERLWAPVEALRPEQNALNEEEERLDRRIDAIEDREAVAAPGELKELRARNAVVSRRIQELDDREEALEKVAESKLRGLIDEAIRSGRATLLR